MADKKILTKTTILSLLERMQREQVIREINLQILLSAEAVVMDQWCTNFFEQLKKDGSYLDNRAEALIETYNSEDNDITILLACELLLGIKIDDVEELKNLDLESWLSQCIRFYRSKLIQSFD